MPDYSNAYQRATQQARELALSKNGVPRTAYEALLQVYARAINDIDKDITSGAITKERANLLREAINKRMIQLGARLGIILESQQRSVMGIAIAGHQRGIKDLQRLSSLTINANFAGIPDETLQLMMVRRGMFGADNYATVIKRGLKSASKDIDRIISSAIARGVSAERASQEVAGVLVSNDSTGELMKLVSKEGRLTKSAVNKALKEGNINPLNYKKARSAFYDSKRIMVSEINTAFREADILSQLRSPVVKATKWNLSGRHSVPDICDVFAESDIFGLGSGVYPTANVPGNPHPFCACNTTSVIADIEEWGEDKPQAVQPPRLMVNKYGKLFKKQTPHYAKTQINNANEYLGLAYQVSKKIRAA